MYQQLLNFRLSEDDLAGEHVIDLRQGGFVGITGIQVR